MTETPDNPWKFQNSSLFWRLDTFMERCHDMMDMMSTCVQFNKLERVEIGNTKVRGCGVACWPLESCVPQATVVQSSEYQLLPSMLG
jgi:hypothetical protein